MYLTMANVLQQVKLEKKRVTRRSLKDILNDKKKQIKTFFQKEYEKYKKRILAYQKEKALLKEEFQYSKEEQKMTKERRERIKETEIMIKKLSNLKIDMTRKINTKNSVSKEEKEQAERIVKVLYSTNVPSQKEIIIRFLKKRINDFKEEDTSKYSFNDYFSKIEDIDEIIVKYCRTKDITILKYLEILSKIKQVYLLRMQKNIIGFVTKFDNQLEQFILFCESNQFLEEDITLMNSNYEYIVEKIQKYYFGNKAFGDLFVSIREKILKINKILIRKEKEQVQENTLFVKQKVA